MLLYNLKLSHNFCPKKKKIKPTLCNLFFFFDFDVYVEQYWFQLSYKSRYIQVQDKFALQ